MTEPRPLWPHQQRGIDGVTDAVARGFRRVCLTSPTGGGKTRTVAELVRLDLAAGRRVSLYTNRKLLLEQASEVFGGLGLPHGVRAAGTAPDLDAPFQISSIQTDHARVVRGKTWDIHAADRVYVDEGHLHVNDTASRLVYRHLDRPGCAVVYVTATPIAMANVADVLVVAGTTSELRACGALVPAAHFGPDEPGWKAAVAGLASGQDPTEAENVKAIMRPGVFGRVYDWWARLNPEGKPTILFAPGVGESLWFAEQFRERGVSAAHIDGQDVWVNGVSYRSDRKAREDVLEQSRTGAVKVVSNRFVLREGIDMPWLAHGILATVFGSLVSYLQAGGRLLRAFPGLERVVIQDHGGNWHRHGSLNADREWDMTLTPGMIAGMRADRLRAKAEREPGVCPRCSQILARRECPCGFVVPAGSKTRPVIQTDGSLVQHHGDIYAPRERRDTPDAQKKWVSIYFRASKSGMTFKQASGLFFKENGYWPLENLKFMPMTPRGWYLRCCDCPREDLYS